VDTDYLLCDYSFKKGNRIHKKRLSKKYVYELAQQNKYDELTKKVQSICIELCEA
jgi:hypothetical protein